MTRLNPLMKVSQHFEETLRHARAGDRQEGGAPARARVAARHGHPADALRPVPARVLRRDAAADHDRAGARAAPGGDRGRRADDGARRARRGADHRASSPTCAPTSTRDAADHAQPRHRRRGVRPRRGHVRGRIVEQGPAYDITTKPAHPYSRELLRSTISLSTTELHSIPGAPPNLVDPPPACRFHPRCPDAMKVCATDWPPNVEPGRPSAGRSAG